MKMNIKKQVPFLCDGIDKTLYQLSFNDVLTSDDAEYWIWQFIRRSREYRKDIEKCWKCMTKEFDKEYMDYIEGDIGAAVDNSDKREKWQNHFKKKYGLEKPLNYNCQAIWREHFYPAIEVLPEKTSNSLREITLRKNEAGKIIRVATKLSFKINLLYDDNMLLSQFERLISYIKVQRYAKRCYDRFKLNKNKVTAGQKDTYEQDIHIWDVREYLIDERERCLSNKIPRGIQTRKRIMSSIEIKAVQDFVNSGKIIKMKYGEEEIKHTIFAPKKTLSYKNVRDSLIRMEKMIERGGYKTFYTK